ncbi:MAG: hypothetical protein QN183_10550 [Armatimonadota bacterium]|nr:hypothetical protein [Armatimonadota bacterium]MDR7485491.1 hypothetical protein [Armatimonadota bacterium]MDR7533036.1 hypothetical protein [Armatimonadota bacterium]MDR7536792.1 hypothetical protein [Armatimonadota bacterium]
MAFRLLIAEPHVEFRQTVREVVEATRPLLPVDLEVAEAATLADTHARLAGWRPHALLLDWDIAADATPLLLNALQHDTPGLRVLVMLPGGAPQYRAAVWTAGACAGIPRDRLDGEWLATAVCLVRRAMEREAHLWQRAVARCPVLHEAHAGTDPEVAMR